MKKSTMKKCILFLTAIMMILSLTVTAFASEPASQPLGPRNSITPFFVGLNTISYNLYITNGKANPVMTGTTYADAVDYVTVNVDLKRSSGSTWTTIKSWSKNITVSDNYFTFNEKYSVSKGYSYKYTATVESYKDGDLLDSVTFDSQIRSY